MLAGAGAMSVFGAAMSAVSMPRIWHCNEYGGTHLIG
jgi:hypothetical protein